MNGSGGLLGAGVSRDGPGAALVFTDGEERNQAEYGIRGANQAREAALSEAIAGEEFGGIGVGHFGEFGFDFAADGGGRGVASMCRASRTGGDARPSPITNNLSKAVLSYCSFYIFAQL